MEIIGVFLQLNFVEDQRVYEFTPTPQWKFHHRPGNSAASELVTFLGMVSENLRDPWNGELRDLQLGDQKFTL